MKPVVVCWQERILAHGAEFCRTFFEPCNDEDRITVFKPLVSTAGAARAVTPAVSNSAAQSVNGMLLRSQHDRCLPIKDFPNAD
jgi:hypothetical protein